MSAQGRPHGGGDLLSVRNISIRTAVLGTALALGSAAPALAADPDVYEAPTISGTAQVGNTLTANGGRWTGPSGTTAGRAWLRCTPRPTSTAAWSSTARSPRPTGSSRPTRASGCAPCSTRIA